MSVREGWRQGPWRGWAVAVIAVMVLLLALAADGPAWHHLVWPEVYGNDLGRLLRCLGFLGTWALAALLLALVRPGRQPFLLLAAPALAVVAAEVLKLLIRRERPGAFDAAYHLRPWSQQPWSAAGLGLPSSHAAVAFAGAAMLALLVPRWRWPLAVLATGCALTRVLDRAHFLSDVVVGAGLGVALSWWLHRRWGLSGPGAGAGPEPPAAAGPPSGPRG